MGDWGAITVLLNLEHNIWNKTMAVFSHVKELVSVSVIVIKYRQQESIHKTEHF